MARCSRRRCARHLVLAWLLGSLVGLAQTTHAAERQLFMLVVGQSGQPVLDVSTADLSLEQVGAECTVNGLYPKNVPMKVALLVDNSDAAGGSLNSLREGLRRFLDTLPAQHEVGLFTKANIHDGGGRYISLLGPNGLFHHPHDRGPVAVDVDRTVRYADAFAEIALKLTSA